MKAAMLSFVLPSHHPFDLRGLSRKLSGLAQYTRPHTNLIFIEIDEIVK
jgi:hypothetical protein